MCSSDLWEKIPHQNNEAWDLLYYCIGVSISKLLMIDRIDWANPPPLFDEWNKNPLVYAPVDATDETGDNVVIHDAQQSYSELSWDEINRLQGA